MYVSHKRKLTFQISKTSKIIFRKSYSSEQKIISLSITCHQQNTVKRQFNGSYDFTNLAEGVQAFMKTDTELNTIIVSANTKMKCITNRQVKFFILYLPQLRFYQFQSSFREFFELIFLIFSLLFHTLCLSSGQNICYLIPSKVKELHTLLQCLSFWLCQFFILNKQWFLSHKVQCHTCIRYQLCCFFLFHRRI